jgi:signal transduction histidine kinase
VSCVKQSVQYFTVDARLLRELGERLVGQPHIALAELIKNAFDADARLVEIRFDEDRIIISDDGHGMSESDFSDRWMRIGTGRKETDGYSPELRRAMTGSKGVGRLAAQLLASHLELQTVGLKDPTLKGRARRKGSKPGERHPPVKADVDWGEALVTVQDSQTKQKERDLQTVPVQVLVGGGEPIFAAGAPHGTTITLSGLTSRWTPARFRALAEELWALQPPFDIGSDDESAFRISLESPHANVVSDFDRQMRAILDIWTARVTGTLLPLGTPSKAATKGRFNLLRDIPSDASYDRGEEDPRELFGPQAPLGALAKLLDITVEIRGQDRRHVLIEVPNCALEQVSFEIRLFNLRNRQPKNIRVEDARKYLNRYGGVHIHDGGFRLPYYGPDQDWLHIEQDHAHRLSASRLLPRAFQAKNGLRDLPTNSRLYGSVNISTSIEASAARHRNDRPEDALALQVTRDRLVANIAFHQLRVLVRVALDLYAMEFARSRTSKPKKRTRPRRPSRGLRDLESIVEGVRGDLPTATYRTLHDGVRAAIDDATELEAETQAHLSLLGALATAGITTLAYEHEMQKLLIALTDVAEQLAAAATQLSGEVADTVTLAAEETHSVILRAERLRQVFSPLSDEESRTQHDRFPARRLVRDVADQLNLLARGAVIDSTKVPSTLKLPPGSYPAWSAVVQNILVNAFNAMVDADEKRVDVDGGTEANHSWLRFQDTGVGVDVGSSERLFEPFVRSLPASKERAALGLGPTRSGEWTPSPRSSRSGHSSLMSSPMPSEAWSVGRRPPGPRDVSPPRGRSGTPSHWSIPRTS